MGSTRMGLIGASRIAANATAPAMHGAGLPVLAVASRSHPPEPRDFGRVRWYSRYQDLLQDPDVDAVYISIPNDLHGPWSILALEAGKHVICEKPAAMNHAEWLWMQDAASKHDRVVMEAIMYRFHPQWQKIREWLPRLGTVQTIRSFFCHPLNLQGDYRADPKQGGGALYDLGVYALNAAAWMAGNPIEWLAVNVAFHPEFAVDATVDAHYKTDDQIDVSIRCSLIEGPEQFVELTGTQGRLLIEQPFTVGQKQATLQLELEHETERITLEPSNFYVAMFAEFAKRIDMRPTMIDPDDTLKTLILMDKIRELAKMPAYS